ncbi:hypothetical protein LUZ60_012567 [Juncus effusus]|nr:hypothetical protein LUZ60_012567 [Juncus effusus]
MAENSQSQDKLPHLTMSVAPVNRNHVAMTIEPDSSTKSSQKAKRNHCCTCCCAFISLIFILVIILVIISLTLYKVKNPVMTMKSVSISDFLGGSSISPVVTVNASAFVSNPNSLSMSYKSTTIGIYYHGKLISQYEGPGGVSPAKQTILMNATFDLKTSDLMNDSQFMDEFISGVVGFNTSTFVGGTVRPFVVLHKRIDVVMNCTVMIDMMKRSMKNSTCWEQVKLW